MDEMRFDDLTPIEIPVSIGAAKYVLREASEAAVTTYRDTAAKCVTVDGDESKTITGSITGANAVLVSECLFDVDNRRVAVDVVRTWPARVVKALFEKAYELAGLKDEEATTVDALLKEKADIEKRIADFGKDKAKNEPDSITGGSD